MKFFEFRFDRAITPGSSNLVPLLVKQGLRDLQKPVNKLTLEEWIKIADTFEDWPFRPHVSFNSCSPFVISTFLRIRDD